ncbi:hypothetical protein LEP1GSC016_0556 [Leptospira borgpetersenii serovar Hardjo-bovis str. Sponselee]|uniref:Uncharacterized protein n=1 Tax=Leptospira borgpetersenii serovar Hardjo-bovis str. Sponselee TaxID=1303729 RepID=M6BZL0_LEPBO|nr:hypothetical protein LEP1GSC016_0556 [Leptospira borgpetersenii serovar Hardjo-bovis str. Sponselee]
MNVLIDKIKFWFSIYQSLRLPFRILLPLLPVLFLILFLSMKEKNKAEDIAVLGPVAEKVYGLGTVHSLNTFRFRVGVPTKITKVFVLEGDEVAPGRLCFNSKG